MNPLRSMNITVTQRIYRVHDDKDSYCELEFRDTRSGEHSWDSVDDVPRLPAKPFPETIFIPAWGGRLPKASRTLQRGLARDDCTKSEKSLKREEGRGAGRRVAEGDADVVTSGERAESRRVICQLSPGDRIVLLFSDYRPVCTYTRSPLFSISRYRVRRNFAICMVTWLSWRRLLWDFVHSYFFLFYFLLSILLIPVNGGQQAFVEQLSVAKKK